MLRSCSCTEILKPARSRASIAATGMFSTPLLLSSENGLDLYPGNEEADSLAESLKKWKPWPDTLAALRVLETHFQLAIISNVDDDLFAATRPQLEVDFAQIITAQQARAYKPSLKIFELALSRIGVPAHRVLHVAKVSTMT